jgi:DNA-binding LacI/PurR family transcriptional regulator
MVKVTIQEIVDKLGISRFAVSWALGGGAGVSEETRDRDWLFSAG